ncbi:telomere repeats-binding bouquet formation protein 2 isoform X2 [Callorhinchus milii]|uniref:telomere repeats-binding bouquet formation protein 2 isoform X2 n=1 Tax=Callorhinchus milii TaxID=7868 RepID=UPI0004572A92|nr:telomere repeats-binding bouquet formation protein 2 isoform X2 [Callorhinchus milii]|eukprot:gi/632938748/ref/XP_007906225.1/ PREDICTED: uncharacterized protein C15orf43 homolog isoform X2 [Callorhinchus milii]
MYRSEKGWFSESVSRQLCNLWVSEGGIITNWRSADFLFSTDASHPDTQRIFESLEFVEDNATVFHASYLVACEQSGIKGTVAIGHFLLPPSCLHKEIRAAFGNFIWEHISTQKTYEKEMLKRKNIKMCYTQGMKIDRAGLDVSNNDVGDQNSVLRTSLLEESFKPVSCCHLQQMYPVNNMVTGFTSVDELKKYPGDLHDFIPGGSGYSVCRTQNETNMFSVLKRTNRNKSFIHTN